jgi:3-oxoacyl-[acyl-carrier-protein] synthase-3
MAVARTSGVAVAGVAAAVPARVVSESDLAAIYGPDEAKKICDAVGVRRRHVTTAKLCTSDLGEAAARRLIDDLGWQMSDVDLLIFISQTPDYVLPATACALHGRLGLKKDAAAFDINLGCSGYVYGLWTAVSMMQTSDAKRALLFVGDTISRLASPHDRSVAPLFGDCGTVTALEKRDGAGDMLFQLGTDGRGTQNLIVPAGGFRTPRSEESGRRTEREGGNVRSEEDLFMDGPEIFSFSLREVKPLVASVLANARMSADDVDHFVFHQANRFMLDHLVKRLKLPEEKVVIGLSDYGNTSSASIPLALITNLRGELRERALELMLVGFGVGYSWGAVQMHTTPMTVSDLIVVEE